MSPLAAEILKAASDQVVKTGKAPTSVTVTPEQFAELVAEAWIRCDRLDEPTPAPDDVLVLYGPGMRIVVVKGK